MALEFDVTAESAVTDGDLASESRMRSQGCWKRYKAKRSWQTQLLWIEQQ